MCRQQRLEHAFPPSRSLTPLSVCRAGAARPPTPGPSALVGSSLSLSPCSDYPFLRVPVIIREVIWDDLRVSQPSEAKGRVETCLKMWLKAKKNEVSFLIKRFKEGTQLTGILFCLCDPTGWSRTISLLSPFSLSCSVDRVLARVLLC